MRIYIYTGIKYKYYELTCSKFYLLCNKYEYTYKSDYNMIDFLDRVSYEQDFYNKFVIYLTYENNKFNLKYLHLYRHMFTKYKLIRYNNIICNYFDNLNKSNLYIYYFKVNYFYYLNIKYINKYYTYGGYTINTHNVNLYKFLNNARNYKLINYIVAGVSPL